MRLLLDNCFGPTVRSLLERAGHEVLRVAGPEEPHPDPTLLARSAGEGLIIVTEDSDIDQLAARQRHPHCGIIRISQLTPPEAADRLIETLESHVMELAQGAVLILKGGRTRVTWSQPRLRGDED